MTGRRWILIAALASGCGRLEFAPIVPGDGAAVVVTRSQLVLATDPGELLADFPLLVVLDDQRAARDLMQPDASDLRFYDASGNVLAHEIEQLGAAGGPPLIAWVRVPAIQGTTTTVDVDYGHGTPPPPSSLSVWSATYRGVWHLADLTDSTANHHDGSWVGGAMLPTAGIAGPTFSFVGAAADAVQIPDAPDLALTSALTISGWLDAVAFDAASGYTCIASRQNGAATDDDFWIGVDNPGATADAVVSVPSGTQYGTAGSVVAVATWLHIAMSYDGAIERLYVDGVQRSTTAVSGNLRDGQHPVLIGADHNSTVGVADADFVDGKVDEIRLESIVRSAAWIAYDDLSVRDQLVHYSPVTR